MKKNNKQYFICRALITGLLLTVFPLTSSVEAATVTEFGRIVSMTANEQPIDLFLQELFGQIDVPVIVDEGVKGSVNGSFTDISAKDLFNNLSKTFGLVMYYDGAVVHVYTSNNLSRKILAVPKHISRKIIRSANDLRLTDNKNNLRKASDGGLVVTGTKRFIEQIEELVYAAQMSVRGFEPPSAYRVFYLKYAWAQDVSMTFGGHQVVVPGVASILRSLAESGQRSTVNVVSQDHLIRPTRPGLRGQGLGGIGTQGRLGVNPGDSQLAAVNAGDSKQTAPYAGVSTVSYDEKHISSKGNNIRIVADQRLNAIIIRDAPGKMSHYERLIQALDVEPQMLEIEATIIDINTDRLRELGINWRWQNGDDEVLFGDGSDADLLLRPNAVVTPSGRGSFISFILGDNAKFIGRINALEAQGAAKVVSRPHVLTLSNVEAIFDNSSTFYVRVAGREEVDLFNISVGTKLRVTPHVFKDNGEAKIKLLITIEDGQQKNQQVDNIPVIETSAINTQALIDAGESILIGGLVRETSSESEDRVPLLGKIPVLGHLFKTNTKSAQRIERMFLISPRLASNNSADRYKLDSLLERSKAEEVQATPEKKGSLENPAYSSDEQLKQSVVKTEKPQVPEDNSFRDDDADPLENSFRDDDANPFVFEE